MSSFAESIDAGRAMGKLALYFGCWGVPGHYLHAPGGRRPKDGVALPWPEWMMDGTLLENGKRPDVYDGKVFWTCGGTPRTGFWYAFFWWDRSGDRRGASNSGFYVRGFGWPETREAFDYARAQFPHVVERQRQPLILQNPNPPFPTEDQPE